MIQADLDEYMLQLRKEADETHDFQEVSFGVFEKQIRSTGGKKKVHDYFNRYDQDDNKIKIGSLFKQKDRIRLIYFMLCDNLDVDLLMNLGIICNYMPLSNQKNLDISGKKMRKF